MLLNFRKQCEHAANPPEKAMSNEETNTHRDQSASSGQYQINGRSLRPRHQEQAVQAVPYRKHRGRTKIVTNRSRRGNMPIPRGTENWVSNQYPRVVLHRLSDTSIATLEVQPNSNSKEPTPEPHDATQVVETQQHQRNHGSPDSSITIVECVPMGIDNVIPDYTVELMDTDRDKQNRLIPESTATFMNAERAQLNRMTPESLVPSVEPELPQPNIVIPELSVGCVEHVSPGRDQAFPEPTVTVMETEREQIDRLIPVATVPIVGPEFQQLNNGLQEASVTDREEQKHVSPASSSNQDQHNHVTSKPPSPFGNGVNTSVPLELKEPSNLALDVSDTQKKEPKVDLCDNSVTLENGK